MINVSTAFKNAMKAPVKTVSATVAFVGGDTYTSGDNLVKCELQASGYYFGVATKAVTVVLLGTDYNLVDKKFDLTLKALADSANDTWEDCILGRFKVVEQTIDLEKEMTTLKAYDAIGIIGSKLYKEGDFAFPVTVNALAERLAIDSGMDIEELELVNGTYEIPEDLYAKINNITHRDILAEISGATASLAAVHGVDSELTFTTPMMEPVDSLSYDNLKKVKLEPKYGKVSSVVIARTPQEDNIAVVDDKTEGLPTTKNLFDYVKAFIANTAHGITATLSDDGTITYSGTLDINSYRATNYVDITDILEDGETYVLSKSNYADGSLMILEVDGQKTGSTTQHSYWASRTAKATFTVDKTTYEKYSIGICAKAPTASGWDAAHTITAKYQLEKGTTPTPFELFIPNGIVEVKLANNEILDDNREAMAEPILEVVKGLEFSPFEATTEGHGWHEIGDRIRIFNDTPNIPVEYQEVEYIQTTGTQFIDTGFKPTPLTKTRMEWMFTSTTVQQRVFAVAQSGTGLIYQMYANGAFGMGVAYQDNTGQWTNANTTITANEKMIYELDGKNKKATGYRGDGTQVGTRNLSSYTATQVATYPLHLMAEAKTDGTGARNYSTGRFYSCKIWDDDVLVRDFVPCYRKTDGTAGLYDKVNGVFYENAGTGVFTVGAKTGTDVDNDRIADIVITDIKLTIDGGLTEVLKGVAPDETKTNYALAGGIKKTIYNTEIKVDKQGQEITSVVSRQEQFENETLENFTQVVQNISGITTTIQTTGGGNLVHNSVGYNVDSNRNLVNWTSTGTVSADSSPESVSYGALSGNQINLSASSSITQRIAVDTQGSVYSFSFKAKKGATGTATIHLRNSVDDYSITLPANQAVLWQSYNLNNLTPHDSYFDVVVETNSGVTDFAITDIILNVGDSNTPWVPASDEILSKSVAIDGSGVTVRSNTNDDYVKLDEFGLNGYHGQSNVFKLQQDVTEVAKLKARNQIEMPPIKIVPITSGSRAGWCFVKEEN